MRSYRKALRAVAVTILAMSFLAACGDDNDDSSTATTAGAAKPEIRIAGTDFTEQDVVGNIYLNALKAKGYKVTFTPHLGKREVLQPAIDKGDIDLVPEYVGTYLEYLQPGAATSDLNASLIKVRGLISSKGLTALTPAPAYNSNTLAVTKATATRYNLVNTSDLAPVAKDMTVGGPPECPKRPLCGFGAEASAAAIGYPKAYGLKFKEFKSLDVGGPITKNALRDGSIQVAVLFTSDIPPEFVVLKDDKGLQPAENIVPVIRTAKATAEVKQILDAVSAKLTNAELFELNSEVTGDAKRDPADVAEDWVKENGFS